jgi:hypothetical protein
MLDEFHAAVKAHHYAAKELADVAQTLIPSFGLYLERAQDSLAAAKVAWKRYGRHIQEHGCSGKQT